MPFPPMTRLVHCDRKRCWVEGRSIQIDYRWAPQGDQLQTAARELVALAPELILVQSDPATAALLRETRTIPIVFVTVGDPIGGGFIRSMARPAGNATGFANFEPSIGGKENIKPDQTNYQEPAARDSCWFGSTRSGRHLLPCRRAAPPQPDEMAALVGLLLL